MRNNAPLPIPFVDLLIFTIRVIVLRVYHYLNIGIGGGVKP